MAINLQKGRKVQLKKASSTGIGQVLINLNWNSTPLGFWANFWYSLFGGGGIDLDLGCMYELKNGDKGTVQALGNKFGLLRMPPYISLDGDDRTGESSEGENLRIEGNQISQIKRVLVYTFIYDGVANWRDADAIVTIKSKNSMMDFIFTTKASNKYVCAVYGTERLNEKCNRIFASLREEDKGKGIFKIPKSRPFNPDGSDNLSKFSNSPESVFIDNSDIRQKEVPDYLDKEWYIWFAIKRLKDFGIDYVRADGVLPPPPPPTKTELAQMAKFEACKKFFEENGHLKPKAKTIVDDINISSWLNTIKKNFKDGKLSAEDIDRYTAIGMDFTVTAKGKTKAKVVEVEDTIE